MMTLHIQVGESMAETLDRARVTMEAIERGEAPAPYHGVSFDEVGQMLSIFTPKRWKLVAHLKAAGPLSIYALAKQLGRHYSNVHADVTALVDWLAIEKDDEGRVYVPWDEIDVHWPLVKRAA